MKIAVTIGDPSGIGPELVLKTMPAFLKYKPIIYGNARLLDAVARDLGLKRNFRLIKNLIVDVIPAVRFVYGKPDERTGRVALYSIESALADNPDILITTPIVKNVIRKFDRNFVGHTEYLADYYNCKNFAMVGLLGNKRIMFLTTHLALADVPKKINKDEICQKLTQFDYGLKEFFGIKGPELAVSSLNPHGNEFGYGEETIIEQGIMEAKRNGVAASGPYPADSLFNRRFDGYLVMYHDQGFVYLKSKPGGVNWTLGLPVIRTSPLYGAALDIAGRNCADHTGMISAIKYGIIMYAKSKRSRS